MVFGYLNIPQRETFYTILKKALVHKHRVKNKVI